MNWLERLLLLNNERYLLLGGFITVLFIIFTTDAFIFTSSSNKQTPLLIKKTSTQTTAQLQQVENTLQLLAQQVQESNVHTTPQFKVIATQIKTIQTSLATLNANLNEQQFQTLITHNNQVLLKQLKDLQQQRPKQTFKKKTHHPNHLSPAALPFKVMSVDIWNGEPEATLSHHGNLDLMGQGDTVAGWTLVTLSFDSGKVVFKNSRNQLVTVAI